MTLFLITVLTIAGCELTGYYSTLDSSRIAAEEDLGSPPVDAATVAVRIEHSQYESIRKLDAYREKLEAIKAETLKRSRNNVRRPAEENQEKPSSLINQRDGSGGFPAVGSDGPRDVR